MSVTNRQGHKGCKPALPKNFPPEQRANKRETLAPVQTKETLSNYWQRVQKEPNQLAP